MELPGRGEASGFGGEPDDQETFYVYTDLVTPATVYRLDMATGASTVYRAPKVAFDLGTLESNEVFVPGQDGTMISMYLVYKKGAEAGWNKSDPALRLRRFWYSNVAQV